MKSKTRNKFVKKFTNEATGEITPAIVKDGIVRFEVEATAKHFKKGERADSFECGYSFCLQEELKNNQALRSLLKIDPAVREPRIAVERSFVFIQTGPSNGSGLLPMSRFSHSGKFTLDGFDQTGGIPEDHSFRVWPAPKSLRIGKQKTRPESVVVGAKSAHVKVRASVPRLRRTFAQIMLDQRRASQTPDS